MEPKIHSLGLLSGSFILNDDLQQLRTYYPDRKYLVEQTSKYANKMQKALRMMNIRLDVVLNDIAGQSEMAIIDAILSGERDPYVLASLVSCRVRRDKHEIASSLHGQWSDDRLFELRSCLSLYRIYEKEIIDCDRQIEAALFANAPWFLINVRPDNLTSQ